jgi:hypothetical protein
MITFPSLTDNPFQSLVIPIGEAELTLTLRFYPTISVWAMDCHYDGAIVRDVDGVKLSVGTLHLMGANLPFDFMVLDTTGAGFDPYAQDDFSSGRRQLIMLEPSEIAALRGYDVQI